jgi:AcrR family transcriptional regulator
MRLSLIGETIRWGVTEMSVTKTNLRTRKQQFMRNAIFDAAIKLFAAKGFDETTVAEVAEAAGVSRASFFRYFSGKDDLLAQNVVQYGIALTEAIKACPPTFTPLEVVRQTILSVAENTVSHPGTRQVVELSERSASARQAQRSRLMEVEDSVAAALAKRIKGSSPNGLSPHLLASLTLSVMNVAIVAWFRGEYQDLRTSVEQVFSGLTRAFCNQQLPGHATQKATKLNNRPGRTLKKGLRSYQS